MSRPPFYYSFIFMLYAVCAFCHGSLRGEEKIVQNGQTEPAGVTRRRTMVRREVRFVRSIKHFNYKIRSQTNFYLWFYITVFFNGFYSFIFMLYAVCAFCHGSLRGEEKIVQNGQTEPAGVTRRRTMVRREVKFVRSIKHFNYKIRSQTNFYLWFYITVFFLTVFIHSFLCFMRSVHFVAAPLLK